MQRYTLCLRSQSIKIFCKAIYSDNTPCFDIQSVIIWKVTILLSFERKILF